MKPMTFTDVPPPTGKSGWPWVEEYSKLPETMPNGKPWPKITIITTNYNYGQFLEETIRSVLLQGYPNLEYIIIDGGSTDNSVEIIKKYEKWLSYWVSEADRGQPHAINKGLAKATGTIFNWINSDDLLTPGALTEVAMCFNQVDAVAGSVVNFSNFGEERLITQKGLTVIKLLRGEKHTSFHQPGFWLCPEKVQESGGINESLQYIFDWDLVIRYLNKYPNVFYSPKILARFRLHDNSKTVSKRSEIHDERITLFRTLLTLSETKTLYYACEYGLRKYTWLGILDGLNRDKSLSPWYRVLKIFWAACSDPSVRFSRMTLGALRRNLFRAIKHVI
jgi:glycosyltransferase involved in cell wall biosynthesis